MEISALITMIVILSAVWGGFLYLLFLAYKKEKHEEENS